MPEDGGELRGARNAERQQQDGDQPLLRRRQNPRRHGRHGVAAEAEHHRQHGLAVQPHRAEDAVAEYGEARDVAAVLEKPEEEEERGDNRQDDGDSVGEPHGDEAVLADEEVVGDTERKQPVHQPGRRRVDGSPEHLVLHQPDKRLRAEHADEQVHDVEDYGKDRDAGDRAARGTRDRLLCVGERQGADRPDLAGDLVRPCRAGRRVAQMRDLQQDRVGQRVPQRLETAPFDRDHLDHRDAELRRQRRRVHGNAARQRFVDHVQRKDDRPLIRHDLGGEHQGPADITRVGHLDDQVGLTALEHLTGDPLVFADCSTQRVHAGRVDEVAHLGAHQRAPLGDRHRRSRVIRDRSVAARQRAKHDALAHVRVAHQRDAERVRPKPEHAAPGAGLLVDDVTGHAPESRARPVPHGRRWFAEGFPPITGGPARRRGEFSTAGGGKREGGGRGSVIRLTKRAPAGRSGGSGRPTDALR